MGAVSHGRQDAAERHEAELHSAVQTKVRTHNWRAYCTHCSNSNMER